MTRPILAREEIVIRAIKETHLDAKGGRVSSSLFKGRNISLSRLTVLPTDKILEILRRDLDRPTNSLIGAAEVAVAVIEDAGGKDDKGRVIVRVVADPLTHPAPNPSHAEIPHDLSRSVSKAIIKGIRRYMRPDGEVLEFPIKTKRLASTVGVEFTNPPTSIEADKLAMSPARSAPQASANWVVRALILLAILGAVALLL